MEAANHDWSAEQSEFRECAIFEASEENPIQGSNGGD
jgi:hypothetical protein